MESDRVSIFSYVSHRTSQDDDYSITDEETENEDTIQNMESDRAKEKKRTRTMAEPEHIELLPLLSKPHGVSEKAENSRSDEKGEIDDDKQSLASDRSLEENLRYKNDSDKSEERSVACFPRRCYLRCMKRRNKDETDNPKHRLSSQYVPHGTSENAENSRSEEKNENDDDMQILASDSVEELEWNNSDEDVTDNSEDSSDEYNSDEYDSDEYDSDEYDSYEDDGSFDHDMKKWIQKNIKLNTSKGKQPCDAFGRIEFKEYGEKTATFVRVDETTKMKMNLKTKLWNSSWPSLLISVIGGKKHLQMDEQLKEALGRDLVKTARATDAWIISGGLKTGFAEYIGKAIFDYKDTMAGKKKLVTIGIAPFECVQNKESLVNEEGVWPAVYDSTDDGNQKTYALEPNYSHFFLVDNDNDTGDTFEAESKFERKLIKSITEMKIPGIDIKIPAVVVMLGGRLRNLMSVYDSISLNIPVVIVKGSGTPADFLAEAYQTVSENEDEISIEKKVKDIIRKTFSKKGEGLEENEIDNLAGKVLKLVKHQNLVSVYNINSLEKFDVEVLKAVMKENELVRNMKLALKWNRIDILKNRGARRVEADLQKTEKKWFEENIKLRSAKHKKPTIPCDAFGEIKFEQSSEKTAKFVRVDADTPMEIIIHMLAVVWNLPLPKLLISVTSGQKEFELKSPLKEEFVKSLLKTAKTTSAWIVSTGLHAGVVKHIGHALGDHERGSDNDVVVTIGIAPWNCVKDNESLKNKEGSWPAVYDAKEDSNTRTYALDPNHSHFILVDNGTSDTLGVETEFKAMLRKIITEMKIPGTRIKIPAFEILVEGGLESLKSIRYALLEIPIIIVKGSGGAADFLAKAYQIVSENEDAKLRQKKLEDIIRKNFQEVNNLKSNVIKNMVKSLSTSKMKSNLVTFYSLDSKEKFDVTILTAVIKTIKNKSKKMRLALEWKRPDILKGEEFLWQKNIKKWIHKNIKIRRSGGNEASTPSDAFGEIIFEQYAQKTAKFVRVDHETSMDTIAYLITVLWNLPMPNLFISVMEDETYLQPDPPIQEAFSRGLVKAARTTGAWIISEGLHTGAAKIIGKAIYDGNRETGNNEVVTIGIAPWNCVQNKKSLINEEGVWPAEYGAMDDFNEETYLLDPNHSHFILVDNGTRNTFGVETKFRKKLKETITEMKIPGIDIKIPAIAVMIGGGLKTLQASLDSMSLNIPAVIVKGSGGAADVMADAYQTVFENEDAKDKDETDGSIQQKLQDIIRERFTNEEENLNDYKINLLVESMLKLENRINLVSVYKDSAEDFDVAVLRAVINAKKTSELDQYVDKNDRKVLPSEEKKLTTNILKLILKWNRVDIAKREIVIEEIQCTDKIWADLILLALQEDRVDFVELTIKHGVNLIKIMKAIDFETLHNTTHEKYIFDSNRQTFLHQFLSLNLYSTNESENVCSKINFFIWAFLLGRYEIAYLFWTNDMYAIPSALIANKLLKSLESKCKDYDKKIQLNEHAEFYEGRATGVLTECLNANEKKTLDLLKVERRNWNDASYMQIALNINNEEFMAHNACQSALTKIWMGKMDSENNTWKLLLCILCPLFIFLIKFDEEKQTTHKKNKNPSRSKPSEICSMFRRCLSFYNIPVIKFLTNLIFYIIFLVIFSYELLVELKPQISYFEWLLLAWIISIITEEIHQIFNKSAMYTKRSLSFRQKLKKYFSDTWNVIDVITIILFIIGYVLRFLKLDDAARVMLSLDLMSFYIRFLNMLSFNKHIGPKLVMIKKMVLDFLYFLMVLSVFMTAYGIASQSILYPSTPASYGLLKGIYRRAYFHMYGELFLEEYEENHSCNVSNSKCPSEIGTYVVPVLMCIYISLTNILLLNLLIAMFSHTFQQIQERSKFHWSLQRYSLINEFCVRSPLPPPFILLSNVYQFCRYLCTKATRLKPKREYAFSKKRQLEKDYKDLIHWESQMVQSYVAKQNESDSKNKNLVDQLTLRVEELQRQLKTLLYENSQKTAESRK